jgi:hypothetical protein
VTGASALESATEPHPRLHNFVDGLIGDEIIQQNRRKVPTVIRRRERCAWCSTERAHIINVIRWERVGGYRYKFRPKNLVRMTQAEWTRQEFLRTTDLPAKVVAALRGRR